MVGLVRRLVADQVDGRGADQPEELPDLVEELALLEFVERSLE